MCFYTYETDKTTARNTANSSDGRREVTNQEPKDSRKVSYNYGRAVVEVAWAENIRCRTGAPVSFISYSFPYPVFRVFNEFCPIFKLLADFFSKLTSSIPILKSHYKDNRGRQQNIIRYRFRLV